MYYVLNIIVHLYKLELPYNNKLVQQQTNKRKSKIDSIFFFRNEIKFVGISGCHS